MRDTRCNIQSRVIMIFVLGVAEIFSTPLKATAKWSKLRSNGLCGWDIPAHVRNSLKYFSVTVAILTTAVAISCFPRPVSAGSFHSSVKTIRYETALPTMFLGRVWNNQPATSFQFVFGIRRKKKKKKERKRRKHLTRVPFLARIRSISLKFNRSPRREEHVLKRPAAAFHFNRLLSLQEYFVFPL